MTSDQRCLIFGGSGFIGSHLTNALVKKGYRTFVVCRNSKKAYDNLSGLRNRIGILYGDFLDHNFLENIIKPNDIVFDLISSSVPSTSSNSPIEEINQHITPHVKFIDIAVKKKIKKIIFASSGGGIYGENKKKVQSETNETQPFSPHAIAKLTIENYLRFFSREYGNKFIIYRISNPYGPKQISRQGFAIIPSFFKHVIEHTPPIIFGDGKQLRDFIYIDDLIEAIMVSFPKNTKSHTYNLGSNSGTPINRLWQEIKKLTNSDLNPLFKKNRTIDVPRVILNTERFRKEFKWKPKITLEEGLKKTWEWLKK